MPPPNLQPCYLVLVPLFSAFIWFSTLLVMLLTWFVSGRPKYLPGQPKVVYISDVSASFLKPLFVVASCITGVGLLLTLIIQHRLRYVAGRFHARERVFGGLAIASAFIAMCGLALLSGFDRGRYPNPHIGFLLVFLIGMGLSTIFTVIEYRMLSENCPEVEKLRTAYIAKAVTGLTLVAVGIVLLATYYPVPNVGGVIEWILGFGFTFYLLTFVYDIMITTATGEVGSKE